MTEQASFEEKLKQLDQIVTALEQGNRSLETALVDFKTGVTLAKDLQKTLAEAEKTLAKIMQDDGSMTNLELTNND